jgi:hypothetical protein
MERDTKENKMKFKLLITLTLLISMLFTTKEVSATPILIESSGNLMGATGVYVNGSLFDVSFVDGSCISLYGGCNEVTDFVFTSQTMADAAGAALLSQVLNGAADTNISLVNGIEKAFSVSVIGSFYWNLASNTFKQSSISNNVFDSLDAVQTTWSFGAANRDTTLQNTWTIAVWTAHEVPEPTTLAIFTLGLMGLAVRRFKKQS